MKNNSAISLKKWQQYFNEPQKQLSEIEAYIASIKHPEFTENQILSGFIELFELLTDREKKGENISLRTLSALCFSGDSKFLDQRRRFIETFFPIAGHVLEPRVIMLSSYIPENLERAIFIENFESFRATVQAVKSSEFAQTTAVIYSAGYRSSASVIRDKGNCQFVSINQVNRDCYQIFVDWWYSSRQDIPVFFWGDLDFDGMRILKTLRSSFTNAVAFKAAYAMTLELHQQGICHNSMNPNKGNQKDPDMTGCVYADRILLPIIRENEKFTDQEVIGSNLIIKSLKLQFLN